MSILKTKPSISEKMDSIKFELEALNRALTMLTGNNIGNESIVAESVKANQPEITKIMQRVTVLTGKLAQLNDEQLEIVSDVNQLQLFGPSEKIADKSVEEKTETKVTNQKNEQKTNQKPVENNKNTGTKENKQKNNKNTTGKSTTAPAKTVATDVKVEQKTTTDTKTVTHPATEKVVKEEVYTRLETEEAAINGIKTKIEEHININNITKVNAINGEFRSSIYRMLFKTVPESSPLAKADDKGNFTDIKGIKNIVGKIMYEVVKAKTEELAKSGKVLAENKEIRTEVIAEIKKDAEATDKTTTQPASKGETQITKEEKEVTETKTQPADNNKETDAAKVEKKETSDASSNSATIADIAEAISNADNADVLTESMVGYYKVEMEKKNWMGISNSVRKNIRKEISNEAFTMLNGLKSSDTPVGNVIKTMSDDELKALLGKSGNKANSEIRQAVAV